MRISVHPLFQIPGKQSDVGEEILAIRSSPHFCAHGIRVSVNKHCPLICDCKVEFLVDRRCDPSVVRRKYPIFIDELEYSIPEVAAFRDDLCLPLHKYQSFLASSILSHHRLSLNAMRSLSGSRPRISLASRRRSPYSSMRFL